MPSYQEIFERYFSMEHSDTSSWFVPAGAIRTISIVRTPADRRFVHRPRRINVPTLTLEEEFFSR